MAVPIAYGESLGLVMGVTAGALLFITIFLQTWRHFPKMDSAMRLRQSLMSAGILAAVILVVVYTATVLLTRFL